MIKAALLALASVMRAAFTDTHWWCALALGPLAWLAILGMGVSATPGLPDPAVLVYGVLLYPLVEEILFRGLIQAALLEKSSLTRCIGPLSLANIITSAGFAATHLIVHPPLQAASIFLPSLVFGWAYERYRHIGPAVVLHAVYNAGFLYLFVA